MFCRKNKESSNIDTMYRQILFAVVIFVAIILLMRKKNEYLSQPCSDIAILDRVPLVPPSNMPIYIDFVYADEKYIIADYTGVPAAIANPLKCAESSKNLVVDRKYNIMTNCKVLSEDMPDKMIRVTPALVYAMAGVKDCPGKSPDSVWVEWKDFTPAVVGRILEITREKSESIKTDLTEADMTNDQIDSKFAKDASYMATLPSNTTCADTDERCAQWAKTNDCVVNPNFMLKNCPKSCGSCGYSAAQIAALDKTMAQRSAPTCETHGGYSTDSS